MNLGRLLKITSLLAIIFIVAAGAIFLSLSKNSIREFAKNKKAREEFIGNDTLKLLSVNYLLENAADKYSATEIGLIKPDLLFTKKDYLTNNIELSIQQSKKRLGKKEYTVDQFLNYVLPYRLRYEEPENRRKIAIDSCMDCYNDTLLVHVKNINDKIRQTFRYGGPSIPNRKLSLLLKNKNGICYEMSDMAAFVMRANGKAKNGTIVFDNAPANALYKLIDLNEPGTKKHRCFTVDNQNNQFFWSGD